MAKSFTVQEFFKRFPDDDACLDHLFAVRYGPEPACPKCGEIGAFHRLAKLPAWTCNCGHHLHPMQGTPFERTHTPLQKWFYAMYLFTTSRHGVPAKELQRQLGVTYKTAYRIGIQIRKLMEQADLGGLLTGHVEMDEAYVGGRRSGGKRGRGADADVRRRAGRIGFDAVRVATLVQRDADGEAIGVGDRVVIGFDVENDAFLHDPVVVGRDQHLVGDVFRIGKSGVREGSIGPVIVQMGAVVVGRSAAGQAQAGHEGNGEDVLLHARHV